MWVFIKGIPAETSVKGLHRLIKRQFNPLWSIMPIRGVKVEKGRILRIRHQNSNVWEHYGLVFITPPNLAHAVIGRLNTAKFKGNRLHAHPYIMRQKSRDRRRQLLIMEERYPGERRVSDRRRESLVSQLSDRFD
jgi:hypothetical protein